MSHHLNDESRLFDRKGSNTEKDKETERIKRSVRAIKLSMHDNHIREQEFGRIEK